MTRPAPDAHVGRVRQAKVGATGKRVTNSEDTDRPATEVVLHSSQRRKLETRQCPTSNFQNMRSTCAHDGKSWKSGFGEFSTHPARSSGAMTTTCTTQKPSAKEKDGCYILW